MSQESASVLTAPGLAKQGPRLQLSWLTNQPLVIRITSLVIVLAAWEILGREVNPLLFSHPTAIFNAAVDMIRSGELIGVFLNSLYHMVIGFAIATVLGVAIGALMGRYRILEETFDSFVNAAYVAPHVAFVPLMILWFGLESTTKLFVIATSTIFPILINTQAGAKSISPLLLEVGRSFGLSERAIFLKIVLPAITSHIAVGLRVGGGRAVTNMIIAEYFTVFSGLGGLILSEASLFHTSRMFVGIIAVMLTGITLTALLSALEQRVAGWRETERAAR